MPGNMPLLSHTAQLENEREKYKEDGHIKGRKKIKGKRLLRGKSSKYLKEREPTKSVGHVAL